MTKNKKLKSDIRKHMADTGERYTTARARFVWKFPVATGHERKVFHLYYCRQEDPSIERRRNLEAAGLPFFLRDVDRDPTADVEGEELGIEWIPTVAVCCGKELLIEDQDENRGGPRPVTVLARLQATAYFDEELGRWCVPRDAAMSAGFVQGHRIDRSDERPEDFLDEGVDPDCFFSVLYRYARLQDLKNLLDEVGFSAPPLKHDRTQRVIELFEEGEISGMDIAKHLPRKAVTLIGLILEVDIVGNLFQVRQRLAKEFETRYRPSRRTR